MNPLQRGQVYLLRPGSDGKQRPVVIVSRDELNGGHSVLAIPFYSQQLDRRKRMKWIVKGVRYAIRDDSLTAP